MRARRVKGVSVVVWVAEDPNCLEQSTIFGRGEGELLW